MKTGIWLWRATVTAGAVAAVFLASVLAWHLIDEAIDRRDIPWTETSELSDAYEFEYNRGKVRLRESEGGRYLTPAFDRIYENVRPGDSLTVYFQGDKRGFLNLYTGRVATDALYDRAWIFSEGLAAVVLDGRVGFIDRANRVAIPFRYPFHSRWSDRIDFLFRGGYCTMPDSTRRQGLIDRSGEWALAPLYDCVGNPERGFRVVQQGGRFGVLDSTLQFRIPVSAEWILVNEDGFLVQNNGGQQLLAFDGTTVLRPFVYDDYEAIYFNSGRLDDEGGDLLVKSEYWAYRIGSRYGLMDRNGRPVTRAVYQSVSGLSNDLFACRLDNGWITLNGKGEAVD